MIGNSNASKSVRYPVHVDLSDVDCSLIRGRKRRPGRNVRSIWQMKRKVSLCITATSYDRLEIDGGGVEWGAGFVGLKIISFLSRETDEKTRKPARKRYLYLIFLFPHKTRREFRRLFLPTALYDFFVSRGRATTRSSKLKRPVSRNDGWRFYRTVKTRPRPPPPGGRPAEHLNTPRCFVSFRNGRKNYSPGMTYHPSGAR